MKIPVFIKALVRICDKESSRYALGGIECKSDGTTAQLTATDGRILATVHYEDEDGKAFTAIAPAKELSNGPAATYKAGVRYDGKQLRSGNSRSDIEPIDGKFPKYEPLFTIHDAPDGYVSVQLDATLLRKLCDLSDAINDGPTRGIKLYVKDGTSCVFGATRGENGEVARLAIMPLATDGNYKTPPFPARPGAESVDEEAPAPPPETLDDDAIAEAVSREPEPIGAVCGLVASDGLL